jgi:hypothetical protein
VKVKSFHHCDSCDEMIENPPIEFSEPYDVQDDGSYRVTILNMDVLCPSCGERMIKA